MEISQLDEVRRVRVIYFLCRNGTAEQPHLIRVHHHNRGVRLRDVKRWLSELRGNDMPESFAWSYKRQYKAGHVWQDITDDDLITPISDNEYVLKGSELPHKNSTNPLFGSADTVSTGENTLEHIKATAAVGEIKLEVPSLISPPETLQIDQDDNISPKPPLRLDHGSPETPTLPPRTFNQESQGFQPPPPDSDATNKSSSMPKHIILRIDKWRQDEKEPEREEGRATSSGGKTRNNHNFHRSGSSRKSSHIFRSFLWCRADSDDCEVPVHHRESGWSASGRNEA